MSSAIPAFVFSLILSIIHFIRSLILIVKHIIPSAKSQPLTAKRRILPKHVALCLHVNPQSTRPGQDYIVTDMVACVERVVEWCRRTGVETLSVYDEEGLLKQHHQDIATSLPNCSPSTPPSHSLQSSASSTNSFPLTPPPSDGETSSSSDSASGSAALNLSPVVSYSISPGSPSPPSHASSLHHRNPTNPDTLPLLPALKLHILCRDQSKPAIVQAAQQLAFQRSLNSPRLEVSQVNTLLEGEYPPPDLLIIHPIYYPSSLSSVLSLPSEPMELHSFPPWQIRLTDIFYDPLPSRRFISFLLNHRSDARLIDEQDFRRALDQFAKVDMKVGK